jgi:hypothetical protein
MKKNLLILAAWLFLSSIAWGQAASNDKTTPLLKRYLPGNSSGTLRSPSSQAGLQIPFQPGNLMGQDSPESPEAWTTTYTFAQTSGTYTTISGGTTLGTTSNDEDVFGPYNIGFTFTYNGTAYTQFSVATNGFIGLGGTAVTTSSTPLSTGSSNNVISALGVDLQGQTGSVLQYLVTGTSPNRTLVIQWSTYRKKSATGDNFNFQVRLSETSNAIACVYGAFTVNATNSLSQVGLRGASSADYNNRSVGASQTWATSIAGTTNADNCRLRSTVYPASGQTYTWTGCTITSFPYTQDFSATLDPCWSIVHVTTASGTGCVGTTNWTMATSITYPDLVPSYTLTPQSGSYLASFDSYNACAGTSSRLQTGAFDFTTLSSPSVEFYMSQDAEYNNPDTINIQVSTNGGTSWTTLEPPYYRYNTLYTTPGWKKYTAYLTAYANMNNVKLGFLAMSRYGNMMAIDNVVVKQGILHDVGTSGIWAPTHIPKDQGYHWTTLNMDYGPSTETFDVDTKLQVNGSPVTTVTNTVTGLTNNSVAYLNGTFSLASYSTSATFSILNQTKLATDQNTSNDILVNSSRTCTRDTIYAWDDGSAETSVGYDTGSGWLGQLYYLSAQDTLTSVTVNWGTIPGALAGNSLEIYNVSAGVPSTKFGDIVTGITLAATDANTIKTYKPTTPIILPAGVYWIGAHQSVALSGTYLLGADESNLTAENYPSGFAFYSSDAATWTDYTTSGLTMINILRPNFANVAGLVIQNPVSFAATAISQTEIDLTWALNSSGNNVMLAWNTTATFGTPVNGTAYSGDIPGGGHVLYNGTLLSFQHMSLNSNTHYYYKIWSRDVNLNYSSGDARDAWTFCYSSPAPFTQDFEGSTFPPDCWRINSGSPYWLWTDAASGYGIGTGSALAYFYGIAEGGTFDLMTLQYDASALTSPVLKFDYAYATYAGEVDQMNVYYSSDNGSSYTLLLAMPGGTSGILNTGGSVGNNTAFVPTASQWATQTLALPAGTNKIKFTAISAFGNNLFLDNVKVTQVYAHNVGVSSIDIQDAVNSGSLTPKATIINEGQNTETFNVSMTTTGYNSVKTVTSLASGGSVQVTFDPLTAALGDYSFNACTNLTTPVPDQYTANDCKTKAVKVLNLNKTVYAYNAYPGTGTDSIGPTSFSLATPGVLNMIADQSTLNYVTGGTWANGIWYGTLDDTTGTVPYYLITIDPATGNRTLIGDMGFPMNGLSYNPVNSTMYGVGDVGSNSQLYTLNLTTGAATAVGSPVSNALLINLAINNAGQAYSVDINSDFLGSVNLATGEWTPIGTGIGFNALYAQDMEFDRDNGNLFMAAQGVTTGWLAWVNTVTGTTAKIGDFEGGAEVTGLAIPYTPQPVTKTLTLKVYLEGYYEAASGMLRKAQDVTADGTEQMDKWTGTIVDTVGVMLVQDLGSWPDPIPYDYQAHGIALNTDGTIVLPSIPASMSGNYYIIIRHRQSVETWSASTVSFSGSSVSYDFTTAATQAYGNNEKRLVLESNIYGIYGGDIKSSAGSQDGYVDIFDNNSVFNQAQLSAYGYIPEDLTSMTGGPEGYVDIFDMALVFNNMQMAVGMNTPPAPQKKAVQQGLPIIR